MDKIQIIEKLFYHIVIYSYLILPLTFFFVKDKRKISLVGAIYGAIVFLLLKFVFDELSFEFQLLYLVLYTLLEYLFFSLLIARSINNKNFKKLILVLSICFIVFQIIFGSKVYRLDSISVGIETILLFIYIFLFFYDHSKNSKMGYIYNHPTFWLSVGILLYLGGSLFFNILVNYLTSDEFNNYWHYTYIAEILKNILFSVAMLKSSHQPKINSINQANIPYLDMDIN